MEAPLEGPAHAKSFNGREAHQVTPLATMATNWKGLSLPTVYARSG